MVERNPLDEWTCDSMSRGDVAAVRQRVLDDPGYLASRDFVGNTPLLTAVGFNDVELIRFMLEHGADPDPIVDDGYTSLLTAIESDDPASIPVVALLIEAGADIHRAGTNGWTPLHMAAARGHVEKARMLLEARARVDQRTEIDGGTTPLMDAACQGRAGTVRLLLESGADPTLRDLISQRTSLESAIEASKGADPLQLELLREMDFGSYQKQMLDGLALSPEQREWMEAGYAEFDAVEFFREGMDRIVREGDFEEVIRLLSDAEDRR